MRRVVFSIEGNIGSGKTTLLQALKRANPRVVVADQPIEMWQHVADHNLLGKYYADPNRWAYTFQNYAILTRMHALHRLLASPIQSNTYLFSERSVEGDKQIFAKLLHKQGLMDDMEHALYLKVFESLQSLHQPAPIHKHLYLRTDPQRCWERMQKRGRGQQSKVGLDYLKQIHQLHETWLGDGFVLDGTAEFEQDQARLQQIMGQVDAWLQSEAKKPDQ